MEHVRIPFSKAAISAYTGLSHNNTSVNFYLEKIIILPPHQELDNMFLNGLTHGFRIGFSHSSHSLQSAKKNMQSALEHPEVVDACLSEEWKISDL